MRELITVVSCDICRGALDERREVPPDAESLSVNIDGRPMRLDVCRDHADPTWSQITAYAWPDEIANDPRNGKAFRCPLCADNAVRTKGGLAVHMTRMHPDKSLAERQEAAGLPVTGRNTRPRGKTPTDRITTCPICGKTGMVSTHGVVMHMTRYHREVTKQQRDKMLAEAATQ